jgi:hypothetical protein
MALWVCQDCTTKYAVGLFTCPRCKSTDFVEEGLPMPKISAHAVSNDGAGADETPEEEPSPGTSYSPSEPKRAKSSGRNAKPRQSPAPMTESLSGLGLTESSSVSSTDGVPAGDSSETDSADVQG